MTVGISRLFKSTDAGAPQLYGTSGSVKALLKAVLVTGYGSTLPLGWTMPYEVGNVCVFRMSAGTKTFIRLDDNATDPNIAYIRGFSSMIDVNNGSEPTPQLMDMPFIHKKYSSGASATPWWVIGDEAGFHFIIQVGFPYNGFNCVNFNYIGDYVPIGITNKWNFHLNVSNQSTMFNKYLPSFNNVIQRNPVTMKIGSVYSVPWNDGIQTLSLNGLYGTQKLNGVYYGRQIYISINIPGSPPTLVGGYPGMLSLFMYDTGSEYLSNAEMVPIESVDYNGRKSMIFYATPTTIGSVTYNNQVFRHMILVGKGFRNVK